VCQSSLTGNIHSMGDNYSTDESQPIEKPAQPPLKPESLMFKEEQLKKGNMAMGCGCGTVAVGLVIAVITIFRAGVGSAFAVLIAFGLVAVVFFLIARARKVSGHNILTQRDQELTENQREFEEREETEYQRQREAYQANVEQIHEANTAAVAQEQAKVLSGAVRSADGYLDRVFDDQARLMESPIFKSPSSTLRLRLADAERQMFADEEIAFLLAAEAQTMRTNIIIVTTARLCVLKPSGIEWTPLSQVGRAQARTTVVANYCELNIWTESRHYRWPRVEPQIVGFEIARALGRGKPPLQPIELGSAGSEQVRARAKYSGGNFIFPETGVPLQDKVDVTIVLTNDARLQVLSNGAVVASFPADHPGLIIDSTTTVGRSIKGGPLAATAAAALLLTPLALVAAPLAIDKKRVRQHLVMVITDDTRSGLFAFTDESEALRLRAALAARQGNMEPLEPVDAFTDDDDGDSRRTGSVLEELERLANLRDQGMLSEAEFDQLKRKILE
jgi:hypothetical protein